MGAFRPLHICFDRILPHELKGLQGNVQRLALFTSKKWPSGIKLKCRFLDGSPKMRKKVEKYAHLWEKHEAVKFEFGDDPDAQIRISFEADDGSWSALGTDALNKDYFPPHKPTMNYGWLRDDTPAQECRRVVLHEFGHALGCVHEHESPLFTRQWNREAVYQAFSGPPNNWSRAEIDSNVLDKYSRAGHSATKYDPKSIMLYAFPAELFTDGLGPTNNNTTMSAADKKKIRAMYPPSASMPSGLAAPAASHAAGRR